MFKRPVQKSFLLIGMLLMMSLLMISFRAAADSLVINEPDYSLFPKVRFQLDLDKTQKEDYDLADPGQLLRNETLLDQYDATFYYPLGSKGMSFDLGFNLKYIDGQASFVQEGQRHIRNFSAALPMLSASALFDLPFKGLTAGFEGKHYVELENDNNKGFDYKAKLGYEWDQGFGLQGGWQHQQFSLDNADQTTTDFENKGPFLDFYLRF